MSLIQMSMTENIVDEGEDETKNIVDEGEDETDDMEELFNKKDSQKDKTAGIIVPVNKKDLP